MPASTLRDETAWSSGRAALAQRSSSIAMSRSEIESLIFRNGMQPEQRARRESWRRGRSRSGLPRTVTEGAESIAARPDLPWPVNRMRFIDSPFVTLLHPAAPDRPAKG